MKYKANTRRRALEYEKDWVQRWKDDGTFEKSVEQRPESKRWVFYDGPPFISGSPHHGTLLSSIVKDAIPRYQTMKGKRVERVWGWDCHGLPAERYSEKKLGLKSRQDVLDYGLEKYIVATRDYMTQTAAEWEQIIDRIGRWVDFKGAYKTMDKDYMESVWWAFKTLYDKGKIYEGEKVLMYCTLDGTPLSKAEVTMDSGAYQDVTDPSVYVKFKLSDGGTLLAWTTTPWTLPANTALAVNKELDYVEVKLSPKNRKVFLISGKHALASDDYYPALNQKLEQQGFDVTIIDHIDYTQPHLDKNLEQLNKYDFTDANIVTHSLGAATFLKWLDDSEIMVSSLTMIAPSYPGENIDSSDKEWVKSSGYVGFEVDFDDIRRKISSKPTIIYSDDTDSRNEKFVRLGQKLRADMVYEPNKGHFFEKNQTNEPSFRFDFGERFILAKSLAGNVLQDEKHQQLEYEVIRELKGEELVGLEYEPLFVDRGEGAHKVWAADYVSDEDGTGIVHIAPAYGEEDFALAKEKGIPVVHAIDQNGFFTEGPWKGENVWLINKTIAKDMHRDSTSDATQGSGEQRNEASKRDGETSSGGANAAMRREAQQVSGSDAEQAEPWRGSVWKIDYIRHSYPHCHRCGTRLMYRALPSWFVNIDEQRTLMLEQNQNIYWFPTHVKNGRFAKNIEQAPDWNINRDRFWATALPVWKSPSGKIKVVGSYAELKELSGVELEDYHRPWIDEVTFDIDGETYTRIDKVMDSWFEAGSMPFAQFHYPFENKEKFEANFPGDFIVEYIGQVRAWFYYMHAMSVALFGENSFKNVIVTGNVAGNDGRKMSKSYGNFTDPNELMDKFSADSLRYLLLSSPLMSGEDFALQDKDVGDVARKLSMIWNMYDFFTMYAEVDGWEYDGMLEDPLESLKNPLDIWIVSRIHQLVAEVEKYMDEYNTPDAMSPILPFIDDASNWFVRRSRRRFWKSEETNDKNDAYKTLHYVLTRLSYILAPFTPFLAEELYHNMTGDKESIHLRDWLPAGNVNSLVMNEMDEVRDYVNQGLSLRAKAGLKVRQPLASVTVPKLGMAFEWEPILIDELNIKLVKVGNEVAIDETLTPELKREGLMREVIRFVQNARKDAGLNVDDRIVLSLAVIDDTAVELEKAIDEHSVTIMAETLTTKLESVQGGYDTTVKIDGMSLQICLKKA